MENVVVNSEVVAEAQVAEAQVAEVEPCEICYKVLRVAVEDFNDEDTIRLVIDRKVSGFIKGEDTFRVGEVDYLRFRQSALTAQLCDVSPEFSMYRSLQKERLSRKQLAVLLNQATVVLSQKLVLAGEPVDENGTVKDHDIFVTTIKAVRFNTKVQTVFNNLTERVLFGALDL